MCTHASRRRRRLARRQERLYPCFPLQASVLLLSSLAKAARLVRLQLGAKPLNNSLLRRLVSLRLFLVMLLLLLVPAKVLVPVAHLGELDSCV